MNIKKDFIPGVIIESFPNNQYVDIHTREQLVSKTSYGEQFTYTKILVERILATPGVIQVNAYPYRISIQKSPIYNWDEILNCVKILIALKY